LFVGDEPLQSAKDLDFLFPAYCSFWEDWPTEPVAGVRPGLRKARCLFSAQPNHHRGLVRSSVKVLGESGVGCNGFPGEVWQSRISGFVESYWRSPLRDDAIFHQPNSCLKTTHGTAVKTSQISGFHVVRYSELQRHHAGLP
jgi:hypothetical protein